MIFMDFPGNSHCRKFHFQENTVRFPDGLDLNTAPCGIRTKWPLWLMIHKLWMIKNHFEWTQKSVNVNESEKSFFCWGSPRKWLLSNERPSVRVRSIKADLDIEITHAITGVPSLLFRPGPFKILVTFCIEILHSAISNVKNRDRKSDIRFDW